MNNNQNTNMPRNPLTGARQGQNRPRPQGAPMRNHTHDKVTQPFYVEESFNDRMREALLSVAEKNAQQNTAKGPNLYPTVPWMNLNEVNVRADGTDHINLSRWAETAFGSAIGYNNTIPFNDPVTGCNVHTLNNYDAFLRNGGWNQEILWAEDVTRYRPNPYARNMYALLAMAIWNKLNSQEEFKILLSEKKYNFDFYRYAADSNQRVRFRTTPYIVDIYRAINHAMVTNTEVDFTRWFDTDMRYVVQNRLAVIANKDERIDYLVSVLRDSYEENVAHYGDGRPVKAKTEPKLGSKPAAKGMTPEQEAAHKAARKEHWKAVKAKAKARKAKARELAAEQEGPTDEPAKVYSDRYFVDGKETQIRDIDQLMDMCENHVSVVAGGVYELADKIYAELAKEGDAATAQLLTGGSVTITAPTLAEIAGVAEVKKEEEDEGRVIVMPSFTPVQSGNVKLG